MTAQERVAACNIDKNAGRFHYNVPAENQYPNETEARTPYSTLSLVMKQEEIVQEAEVGASKKVFDLDLPELGPYNLAFTRSGRHMLLGGRKGHLAIMEWQQRHLVCEVQA